MVMKTTNPARRKNAMTLDWDNLHAYLGERCRPCVGEFHTNEVADGEDDEDKNPRVSTHVNASWRSDRRVERLLNNLAP